MKRAAISELKASLSEYLTRVKAGEEVLVTDRGIPVAKLVPIQRADQELSPHLMALERAGLMKIGTKLISEEFWRVKRPSDANGRAVIALLDERASGR